MGLRAIKPQQLSAGAGVEEDLCKIVIDRCQKSDEKTAFAQAQKVWSDMYGEHRESPRSTRFDCGLKRELITLYDAQAGRATEIAWLRNRRRAVHDKAASSSCVDGQADAGEAWLPEHEKELSFQQQQFRKKQYQAGVIHEMRSVCMSTAGFADT